MNNVIIVPKLYRLLLDIKKNKKIQKIFRDQKIINLLIINFKNLKKL